MIATIADGVRNSELRRKLAITIGLLLLYRVAVKLPAPGVSYKAVHSCVLGASHQGVFATLSLFSGGALLQLSVGALGVMPYVTASILMQMLGSALPPLARLKRDGQGGQAKLTQYSRYLTLALASVQASGLAWVLRSDQSRIFPLCRVQVLQTSGWAAPAVMALAMVAGSMLVMWLGENITEWGVGQGVSLLMLTSIGAQLPAQGALIVHRYGTWLLLVAVAVVAVLVVAVVFVEQAQRRLPVTYAHKLSGGRSADRGEGYLPLKVNQAGVVPVIFASSLLYFPTLLVQVMGSHGPVTAFIHRYLVQGDHPVYMAAYSCLIVFLAFFYVLTTYNAQEMAEDLRDMGGFIPGIAPGPDTEAVIDRSLIRLTTVGSIYLAVLALIPLMLLALTGGATQLPLGGTSLLVLVGVGLSTVKQLDAQVAQRRYPAFLLVERDEQPAATGERA